MEVEEMKGVKITPPEKEKLLDTLAEVQGKTRAIQYASRAYFVSATTILKWIADYGIEFDAEGKVVVEDETLNPEAKEETPQAIGDGITDDTEALRAGATIIPKGDIVIDGDSYINEEIVIEEKPDSITITGQETKEIPVKIGYVEYEVGKSTVIVDYRAELVAINGMELPQDEADAIADLLVNIL
jgi:hypothetical protein